MMRCYIYEYEPAICIDVMAPLLLKYYVKKIEEGVKWKLSWDKLNALQKQDCANKGYQRYGQKTASPPYKIEDGPPPFEPTHDKAEIEKQCAALLEFAHNRCYIPEEYWLSAIARARAGVDEQMFSAHEGDFRISMILKVVAAMYDKKYCTFVPLGATEVERRDTYYFPAGAAFCNEKKCSGSAAASIISRNPRAVLPTYCMTKGIEYLGMQQLMLCDVQVIVRASVQVGGVVGCVSGG